MGRQRWMALKQGEWSYQMNRGNPHFVMLKSINGEPMLVNIAAMRTVTTINLAGDEVGVISFDKEHEIVVGSTVADVITAMAQPRIPVDS